jgi:uncharacterized protein
MIHRVEITGPAADLVARLRQMHGPLMFHQSPFYIGAAQFDYWRHTQLIIDVVPGRGGGFSLEAPEGFRFLTRSRVFTDDEVAALEVAGEPPRGA